jgi:hypothetical protein
MLRFLVDVLEIRDTDVTMLARPEAAVRMMSGQEPAAADVLTTPAAFSHYGMPWLPRGDSSGRTESGFVIDLGKARERLRGGDPAVSRTQRLLASLTLAEDLRARHDVGGVNRAELAREHRITRARVTQLLALLSLPAEVLDWIRECAVDEPRLSERRLRSVLSVSKSQQLRAVAALFPSFQRSQRTRARPASSSHARTQRFARTLAPKRVGLIARWNTARTAMLSPSSTKKTP